MSETETSPQSARIVRSRRAVQIAHDFLIGLGVYAVILLATAQFPDHHSGGRNQMFSSSAHAAPMLTLASEAPSDLQPSAVYRSTDRGEATAILGFAFASLVAFNLGVLRHLRRVYASPR